MLPLDTLRKEPIVCHHGNVTAFFMYESWTEGEGESQKEESLVDTIELKCNACAETL